MSQNEDPNQSVDPESVGGFIRYAAKAVAGFAVPWIVFGAEAVSDKLGVEVELDQSAVTTTVTSLAAAIAVFLVRNAPALPRPRR